MLRRLLGNGKLGTACSGRSIFIHAWCHKAPLRASVRFASSTTADAALLDACSLSSRWIRSDDGDEPDAASIAVTLAVSERSVVPPHMLPIVLPLLVRECGRSPRVAGPMLRECAPMLKRSLDHVNFPSRLGLSDREIADTFCSAVSLKLLGASSAWYDAVLANVAAADFFDDMQRADLLFAVCRAHVVSVAANSRGSRRWDTRIGQLVKIAVRAGTPQHSMAPRTVSKMLRALVLLADVARFDDAARTLLTRLSPADIVSLPIGDVVDGMRACSRFGAPHSTISALLVTLTSNTHLLTATNVASVCESLVDRPGPNSSCHRLRVPAWSNEVAPEIRRLVPELARRMEVILTRNVNSTCVTPNVTSHQATAMLRCFAHYRTRHSVVTARLTVAATA